MGKNLKAILFYEEEIKSGGMGMNLSALLSDDLIRLGIKYSVLALDDNFAAYSKEGQNAYQMAGVDCFVAENEIKSIMNNM